MLKHCTQKVVEKMLLAANLKNASALARVLGVSPQALSGPVGIVTMSYKIASQSIADYIYFLGLISSCIAVMNLLPLPIVDGGVIVLLVIEKVKGSPISPKIQEIISYAGMVFLGAVFLWLTYNDILNLIL